MAFMTITVDEIQQYIETDRNAIGATTSTTLRNKSFIDDDTTTYYIDGVNGSDSNAGTKAAPFKTLNKAFPLTPTKANIHLLTDTNPYEANFGLIKKDCNIQSELGKTPHIYLQNTYSGFSTGVAIATYGHKIATTESKAFAVANSAAIYQWDGSTTSASGLSSTTMTLLKRSCYISHAPLTFTYPFYNSVFAYNSNTATNNRLFMYSSSKWNAINCSGLSTSLSTVTDFTVFYCYNNVPEYSYHCLFISDDINLIYFRTPNSTVTPSLKTITHTKTMTSVTCFHYSVYVGCTDGIYSLLYSSVSSASGIIDNFTHVDVPALNVTCLEPYWFYGISSTTEHGDDRLYIGCSDGKVYEYYIDPTTDQGMYTLICDLDYSITSICRKRISNTSDVIYIGVLDRNIIYRYDYYTKELTPIYIDDGTFAADVKYFQTTQESSTAGFHSDTNDGFLYFNRLYTATSTSTVQCKRKLETMKVAQNLLINGCIIKPYNNKFSGFMFTNDSLTLQLYNCTIENITGVVGGSKSTLTLYMQNCKIDNTYTGIMLDYIYDKDDNKIDAYKATLTIKDCVFKNIDNTAIGALLTGTIMNNLFYNCNIGVLNANSNSSYALNVIGNIFLNMYDYAIKALSVKTIEGYNCFYLCNETTYNCYRHWSFPTDYENAPLVKCIDDDDYHLHQILTGSKFNSPCAVGSGLNMLSDTREITYDIILNFQDNFEIVFDSTIFGGILIQIDFQDNPNDVVIAIEESDDNEIFTSTVNGTYISLNGDVGDKFLEPITTKQYIRINITSTSWGGPFGFNKIDYWTRDIGAMNVTREADSSYTTPLTIYFDQAPKSWTTNYTKNDENLTNNILGRKALIARPEQITHHTLQYEEDQPFTESFLYGLSLLHSLNNRKFKIYFNDVLAQTTLTTGTSKSLTYIQIKSVSAVRLYFHSQNYDVTDYIVCITDTSKTWNVNMWKGFYISITYSGITTYHKVLYNSSNALYVDDENSRFTSSVTITSYAIKYFYGMLSTTNLDLTNKYFKRFLNNTTDFKNTIDKIEFYEA